MLEEKHPMEKKKREPSERRMNCGAEKSLSLILCSVVGQYIARLKIEKMIEKECEEEEVEELANVVERV